jgi:hypothetical protein
MLHALYATTLLDRKSPKPGSRSFTPPKTHREARSRVARAVTRLCRRPAAAAFGECLQNGRRRCGQGEGEFTDIRRVACVKAAIT